MLAHAGNRLAAYLAATRAPSSRTRKPRRLLLQLELLEDRSLLSAGASLANAIPIAIPESNHAAIRGYLQEPDDVLLYSLQLQAGDTVTAAVSTRSYGGGLNSYLRVFDSQGTPAASNDNYDILDPRVNLQAAATGTYYVGVSSSGNNSYDPSSGGGSGGSTTGLFDLSLVSRHAPLAPEIVVSSCRLSSDTVAWGDTLTVTYTAENRGGSPAPDTHSLSLTLSSNNRLDGSGSDVALATVTIPPLGADSSGRQTTVNIVLPAEAPAGFEAASDLFLGFSPAGGKFNSPVRGNDWGKARLLSATSVAEPNGSFEQAAFLPLNARASGQLTADDPEGFFKFTPTAPGRVTASAYVDGASARLSLFDEDGNLLVQSDGQTLTEPTPRIEVHLDANTYYLKLETLGDAVASYHLDLKHDSASAPGDYIPTGIFFGNQSAFAAGDFDGDGNLDLALANRYYGVIGGWYGRNSGLVTILLGRGDGTFSANAIIPTDVFPRSMVAGDFNGDGRIDLALAGVLDGSSTAGIDGFSYGNSAGLHDGVATLMGRGDGSFDEPQTVSVSDVASYPFSGDSNSHLVAGDFDGDDRLDLAVDQVTTDSGRRAVTILLGHGDGSFAERQILDTSIGASALASGDFNADGCIDLVAMGADSSGVAALAILVGRGDGSFNVPQTFSVGLYTRQVVAGDFNNDGSLDLAIADRDGAVAILLGNGDGNISAPQTFAAGLNTVALVAADFNGDGALDVAASSGFDTVNARDITILLGRGDGTLNAPAATNPGDGPAILITGDFSSDGRVDLGLVKGSSLSLTNHAIGIWLGRGDGAFNTPDSYPAGNYVNVMGAADFNGDGRLDLAQSSIDSFAVSGSTGEAKIRIFLGCGDGTFNDPQIVDGDFARLDDYNGDGRPDMGGGRSLLLGRGDGTFLDSPTFSVIRPDRGGQVIADFNGDGFPDFLDLNRRDDTTSVVTVELARRDGGFEAPQTFAAGYYAQTAVVGDVNRDDKLDITVAAFIGEPLLLLTGNGDGTFSAPQPLPQESGESVIADLNGDGYTDRVDISPDYIGNEFDVTRITVALGRDDGTFHASETLTIAPYSRIVVVGDFDGDNRRDLAVPGVLESATIVFLGNGDGSFSAPQLFSGTVSANYGLIACAGDFNSDGLTDLASSGYGGLNVALSTGMAFVSPGQLAGPVHSTALLFNPTQDGVHDSIILDRSGTILYRPAAFHDGEAFGAPVPLNPGSPALAVAIPRLSSGRQIAAIDRQGHRLSLYGLTSDGHVALLQSLPTGSSPRRLIAADLEETGRDDLAVLNSGDGTICLFHADEDGVYSLASTVSVGYGASDFVAADVNEDGRLELLVSDQQAGQVVIYFNRGNGHWSPGGRYAAGRSIPRVDRVESTTSLFALEATSKTAVHDMNDDGIQDVLALNPGTSTMALLLGTADGRFLAASETFTARQAQDMVTGDFNADGIPDVALLDPSNVTIYLNDGRGQFTATAAIPAGFAPRGLSIATDIDGDPLRRGILDLLVGNDYGDILVLVGDGHGSFRPYTESGHIALAVDDLSGQGADSFVFANQDNNRVTVQTNATGPVATLTGVQAPGNVQLADLNGDGIQDIIVPNSGGNSVLVYLGTGNGNFLPEQAFPVGDGPVGLTVADLNGDSIPDLIVADKGANAVSVLLGNGQRDSETGHVNNWTLSPGPRLKSGGSGPVSTIVRDLTGPKGAGPDGIPDLLITNRGSNTVTLLPGVGQGFFNDQLPVVFSTGDSPRLTVPAATAQGLAFVTINAGSNNITAFQFNSTGNEFLLDGTFSSGGILPVAALVGDFNRDGIDDLVVANNGDGVLSLLLGGQDGFVLGEQVLLSGVPSPTALAFSVAARDELLFYVTTEGVEYAFPFEFAFAFGVLAPNLTLEIDIEFAFLSGSGLFIAGSIQGVLSSVPSSVVDELEDSLLATVSTVFGTSNVQSSSASQSVNQLAGSRNATLVVTENQSGTDDEIEEELGVTVVAGAPVNAPEVPGVLDFLLDLPRWLDKPIIPEHDGTLAPNVPMNVIDEEIEVPGCESEGICNRTDIDHFWECATPGPGREMAAGKADSTSELDTLPTTIDIIDLVYVREPTIVFAAQLNTQTSEQPLDAFKAVRGRQPCAAQTNVTQAERNVAKPFSSELTFADLLIGTNCVTGFLVGPCRVQNPINSPRGSCSPSRKSGAFQ